MMQFEISPPDTDGIINIKGRGQASLADGTKARAATAALVKEHGVHRILVDFRETRIVTPLHEFMQYYAETANHYPPGTRLALVISEATVPDPSADMELARVVSLAGGIALRDFRSMEKARDWLKRK